MNTNNKEQTAGASQNCAPEPQTKIRYALVSYECTWDGGEGDSDFRTVKDGQCFEARVQWFLDDVTDGGDKAVTVGGVSVVPQLGETYIVTQAVMIASEITP
jgi:hypothetical protein